jgi:hypothetical protein
MKSSLKPKQKPKEKQPETKEALERGLFPSNFHLLKINISPPHPTLSRQGRWER